MTGDLLADLEGDLVIGEEEARALVQRATARAARRDAAVRRATALTQAERLLIKSLTEMYPQLERPHLETGGDAGGDDTTDAEGVRRATEDTDVTEHTTELSADGAQGAADPDEPDGSPRGRDAVLRVMQESPSDWMSVRAVTSRMVERGWAADSGDPAGSVRTTLWRIYSNDGLLEKTQLDGRTVAYRLKSATNGGVSDG